MNKLSKVFLGIIIILICLLGIMIYKYIGIKNVAQFNIEQLQELNIKYKDLIPNYIKFTEINYNSIDNTIFYNSQLNLDEETKENFDLISKEFLNKYPDKQILYLRKMGKIDGQNIYRFIQICDNIIIDDAELNIYFNETSRKIDYIIGVSRNNGGMNKVNWKNISKDNIVKIDKDKIKSIAQKYIAENYNITNELKCETELRYYSSEICWKITFYHAAYEYEIFMDANSGKIINTINRQTLFVD